MTYNTLGVARRTFRFKGTEGVKGRRVVVHGDATNECKNSASANAVPLGATWDSAADDQAVAVQQYGFAELEVSAAVALHAFVNIAADGGVPADRGRVKTAAETAGTRNLVGVAMEAATAAGQIIRVDVRRLGEIV